MNEIEGQILKNDTQKLLDKINKKSQLKEEDFNLENEILDLAKKYDNGVFKESTYIKQDEAYLLVTSCINKMNEKLIDMFVSKVKKAISDVVSGNLMNTEILSGFIQHILNTIRIKDSENKFWGRSFII